MDRNDLIDPKTVLQCQKCELKLFFKKKKPQDIDDDNDDYGGGYDENFRVDGQIFTPLLLPFFFWILYYS